jgi:hypothetical protein
MKPRKRQDRSKVARKNLSFIVHGSQGAGALTRLKPWSGLQYCKKGHRGKKAQAETAKSFGNLAILLKAIKERRPAQGARHTAQGIKGTRERGDGKEGTFVQSVHSLPAYFLKRG